LTTHAEEEEGKWVDSIYYPNPNVYLGNSVIRAVLCTMYLDPIACFLQMMNVFVNIFSRWRIGWHW
jgi:hypothetical protein